MLDKGTHEPRAQAFLEACFKNPSNRILFDALVASSLPNWIITSGCLFQTAWNVMDGKLPEYGVRDYDVFYFDDSDLSWDSENHWVNEFSALNKVLSAPVEVRNQARVHLWYEKKFEQPYPRLKTAFEGIDRFLERVAMVGIYAREDGSPQLWACRLIQNARRSRRRIQQGIVRTVHIDQDLPMIYEQKSYRRLAKEWRNVVVMAWKSG